jgi:hypothetical protein
MRGAGAPWRLWGRCVASRSSCWSTTRAPPAANWTEAAPSSIVASGRLVVRDYGDNVEGAMLQLDEQVDEICGYQYTVSYL